MIILRHHINGFVQYALCTLLVLFLTASHTFAQSFSTSKLKGAHLVQPTSLQFGSDQRLYVSEQYGLIKIYDIARLGANHYQATLADSITLIKEIANHNDNGTPYNASAQRQVTGIYVAGTITNPIIFVTSSDFRQGGGGSGSDVNLDTNSGIVSKLTWNGTIWEMVHLVRGLPRSEENHATNGLYYNASTNTLWVAQGGNTNAGAPSNNFAFLTEYALGAAILELDLNVIENMTIQTDTASGELYFYDLPTVDDPSRPNVNGIDDPNISGYDGVDQHDPFGGADGLNQAKWVENGPVQIYATGFRNIYDLLFTDAGHLYTWDNGANVGWGGHPAKEGGDSTTNNWIVGEPGSSTAGPNDAVVNNEDGLHLVTGQGYYGGHPNPIRANPDSAGLFTHNGQMSGGQNGVFRTSYNFSDPANSLPYDWPPLPLSFGNPIEGDFQNPGVDNTALYTHEASTNGMAEYKASNFGGAMQGDLLAVSFDNKMYRIHINASGSINSPSDVTELATGFGIVPLDVTTTDDFSAFQGNIWVADIIMDSIIVFEPQDFTACTGADDAMIDEDNDGYSNADEIDNDTDPCNGASVPPDFDKTLLGGFLVSNLNDPDDDDDGIVDSLDYFAWDATNGANRSIPFDYPLLNGDPGLGFYGVGFTGLMSNGIDDYLELWKTEENSDVEIVAGGAVGLFSINNITDGDALGSINDQHNGFQFGMDVTQGTPPFVIESALLGPMFLDTILDNMTAGIYIGTGDQDNYFKIGIHSNGGSPGIRITEEVNGVATSDQYPVAGLTMASELKLFLEVFPDDGMVQPKYAIGLDAPTALGSPMTLSGDLLTTLQGVNALAVGIISTSRGTDSTFNSTWDYIKADFLPVSAIGQWIEINDGTACSTIGASGSCVEGRHENGFVQVGNKFYAIGGRENNSNVNIYDPVSDIWTVGADAPILLHHFQAVAYDKMIWVMGAFTGGFPNETPVQNIYIYDPNEDAWHLGPEIPASRRRGSAGVAVYNDKIYLVGGIQNGHINGWVNWLDEYNPVNNTWTILPDATRARDHFQAAVVGNEMFLIGGRRTKESGNTFLPMEQMVDVYNFQTISWDTLTATLPTGRAGASVAVIGSEIMLVGGETESSTAAATSQALNINSDTWRNLASMNVGRHGTQAIANNGGIYMVAGSPIQGEGTTLSYEAYYLFSQTAPILNTYSTSQLMANTDTLNFGEVLSNDTVILSSVFTNTSADQGILISSLDLSNTIDYEFTINKTLPFFLRPGKSFTVEIAYHPDGNGSDLSVLNINHSGLSNQTKLFLVSNGALQPEGIFINSGGPAVITGGVYWQADNYFSSNTSIYSDHIEILATEDDTIYQTARIRNADFSYAIPIDTNWNDLNLHFAELEFVANGNAGYAQFARKFDIEIEGVLKFDDFNINVKNNPETNAKAYVATIPVKVTDGTLNILFKKINEEAWINAISIVPRICPPAGIACDDQNPYTADDVYDDNCNCAGEVREYIWLEAECGTVGSLWTTENSGSQSNGQVVRPPSSSAIGGPNTNANAMVVIPFVTGATGVYKVHGRVKTSSTSNDSYWVKVDDGSWNNWNQINADPYTNTYEWDEVHHYLSGPGIMPVSFNLDPGIHHLYVSYREPNSRLDEFFITNTDSIPQGVQVEGANCGDCMSNNSFSQVDVALCAGDSILINGIYQHSSGIYTDTLTSSDGCDSLLIITLFDADTFHVFQTIEVCATDSVYLGGAWQNSAGTYFDTLTTNVGCDSVLQTTLIVNPVFIDTTMIEICTGDSVFLGGQFQMDAGIYLDSFLTLYGCDSVWATELILLDTSYTYLEIDICAGDSIFIQGAYRFSDSIFVDSLINQFGCDSVSITNLSVHPIYLDTNLISICEGDSVFLLNEWQMAEGYYHDTLNTSKGCDSITVTIVNVHPKYLDTIPQEICVWDSLEVNGQYYSTSGFYQDSFSTTNGCDSIIVYELIVLDSCVWQGGTIIYVDSTQVGLADGSSWATAFPDLTTAIFYDSLYDNIQQIWIAQGTYFPSNTSTRNSSFIFTDSIQVFGSFAGIESFLSERDTTVITTILSGDIGILHDSTDNVFHVVEFVTEAKGVLLDGVQIKSANSDGANRNSYGGAIMNEGIAHVKNVKIFDISSVIGGRVIHVSGPSAVLILENVQITDPGPETISVTNGASVEFLGLIELFK